MAIIIYPRLTPFCIYLQGLLSTFPHHILLLNTSLRQTIILLPMFRLSLFHNLFYIAIFFLLEIHFHHLYFKLTKQIHKLFFKKSKLNLYRHTQFRGILYHIKWHIFFYDFYFSNTYIFKVINYLKSFHSAQGADYHLVFSLKDKPSLKDNRNIC